MKHHETARRLLALIDRYLRETGTGPTAFGIAVMHDGNFVQRLRGGRTPTLQTIDRVEAYIAKRTK